MTIPILSGVITWLASKFPGQQPAPAPNNSLEIRLGTEQYEIYFITNHDEAGIAAFNIGQRALFHPAKTRHGILIADTQTTANDQRVQSAITSNTSGVTTYLCYLDLKEVKKWPKTAP